MDYFDDLDQDAMNEFGELNADTVPPDWRSSPKLSSELKGFLRSTKQCQTSDKGGNRETSGMDYLFKISDPITPTILASAAILASQPRIVIGESEDGIVQFCQVSDFDIPKIRNWLAEAYPNVSPIFAPVNKARKALSSSSAYPTLGYDITLPHHRPQNSTGSEYLPAQGQYPVWYFFYGTLANSTFLAELFGLPGEVHVLVPAVIYGGKLRTWGGKYNALIDDRPASRVDGWAYEVVSLEQEDTLRMYETAKYEVVRVDIGLGGNGGRVVIGCTFRFAGEEYELD